MLYVILLIFMIIGFCLLFSNFWVGVFTILLSSIITVVLNNSEERENAKNERERIMKLSPEERNKEILDEEIDYTILVANDTKKSLGSSVVRGAVGGALLGPVGMVGGALSGKNKSKTTFTIVYKSGRKEVVTVDNDSDEFEEYAEYLK